MVFPRDLQDSYDSVADRNWAGVIMGYSMGSASTLDMLKRVAGMVDAS